ncbi:MAG: peptide chain release factor 2 [Candidatus Hydrogenedentes bacterium]|nr:peptide chain release factor 2 [Candidatus Hydrogenedentota bacterium]
MYEIEVEELKDYRQRLDQLHACLNVEGIKRRIGEIEGRMAAHGFWDDPESAQKILQELKALRGIVAAPEELQRELEETASLIEMAAEENDATLGPDIAAMKEDVERKLRRLEITSLFNDPRDEKNAIVSIHPGAGGTESCDWADMLFRMFTRFCELHEFETEVMDFQPGEEAGLKSATVTVKGPYAYGTLKSEEGVHRLVRISPFDANKRRHTSFAAIEVLPEFDDDISIEVREEDLKMDVFRASGHGGQKVNKTSSAVRLTHLPTGFVVACQVERSQHRNRAMALQMLKAKLYDMEMKRKEAELAAQREGQKDVAWGSQIRSYVLQPYQLVKDLRTNVETSNVQRVLDGDLDMFVEAYLRWRRSIQSVN